MKMLLISESPLEKVGQHYYAVDTWIRFPLSLATHCEHMTLWSPVAVRESDAPPPANSWHVDPGNMKIEHHDNYNTFVKYYILWVRRAYAWRKQAERLIRGHDIIVLRAPSPMLPLISSLAKRLKKPFVVLLCGDIESQSDRIIGSQGLKWLAYRSLVKFWVYQEIRWCKNASIIYAYSDELVYRHRAQKSVRRFARTPHLCEKDFMYRKDSCQGDVIKLLRVCWLLPSKGLEYLFETVAILNNNGFNVELQLVGKERIPGYEASLRAHAEKLNIKEKIIFSGWIPFDRLKEVYVQNDIQVVSSLAEGTPRCIIEGSARGLPLVCTEVGGCVDTLTNEKNALLVPAADPRAMASAVERLIRDGVLRRKMINQGYEMARANTFETLGMQFLDKLREVVEKAKGSC